MKDDNKKAGAEYAAAQESAGIAKIVDLMGQAQAEVKKDMDKEDLDEIAKVTGVDVSKVLLQTDNKVEDIVQDVKAVNTANDSREKKVIDTIIEADAEGASIHEIKDIISEAAKPVKLAEPVEKEVIVADKQAAKAAVSIAEEIEDAIEEAKTDDLAGEIVKEVAAEKAAEEVKAVVVEKAKDEAKADAKESDSEGSGSDDEEKEDKEEEKTPEEIEAEEVKRVAETESSLERLFKQMSASTE